MTSENRQRPQGVIRNAAAYKALLELAETQYGYFATSQLMLIGISNSMMTVMRRNGRIEQAAKGVWQLKEITAASCGSLMVETLAHVKPTVALSIELLRDLHNAITNPRKANPYSADTALRQYNLAVHGAAELPHKFVKGKSFAEARPGLVKFWDHEANGVQTPENTNCWAIYRAHFKCGNGHTWDLDMANATRSKTDTCRRCDGYTVETGETDLLASRPEITRYWDYEKNEKTPDQILATGSIEIYLTCESGHAWHTKAKDYTAGNRCKKCSNHSRTIPGESDFATLYPELGEEFDGEANEHLASWYSIGYNKPVGWKCKAHGHKWPARIKDRIKGHGCPVCAYRMLLSGFSDMRTRRPDMAALFAEDLNGISASHVLVSEKKPYMWRCLEYPEHVWPQTSQNVFRQKGGEACPFCGNRAVFTNFNDLKTIAPDVAPEFDEEVNAISASEVLAFQDRIKYGWTCKAKGHKWPATIYARVVKGTGCPDCTGNGTSKVEGRLRDILIERRALANVTPNHRNKVHLADNTVRTQLDIVATSPLGRKVVIQYDGHRWHRMEKIAERDLLITRLFIEEGYIVVRVRENPIHFWNVGPRLERIEYSHPDLFQVDCVYRSNPQHITQVFNEVAEQIEDFVKSR